LKCGEIPKDTKEQKQLWVCYTTGSTLETSLIIDL
jgi:hypothetical protein